MRDCAPGGIQTATKRGDVLISDERCVCFVTDEKYWFRYGSAVEPGSQMEWNPDCPVHPPAAVVACTDNQPQEAGDGSHDLRP